MYELEIYKLITDTDEYGNCLVSEFGWNGDMCLAWISYSDLEDFMQKAIDIFGYGLFDDGAFNANMQSTGICLDICEAFGNYVDIANVFPKDKYEH